MRSIWGSVCKGFSGADSLGNACSWKAKWGLGVKSIAKELSLYPEGSAEALQGFEQRCGVMRFTTETSLRLSEKGLEEQDWTGRQTWGGGCCSLHPGKAAWWSVQGWW